MTRDTQNSWSDFTEAEYRNLVQTALSRFVVKPVKEAVDLRLTGANNVAAWRHDIDFSPHRALALAKIEADLGLRSTFYVLLNGSFYNPLEAQIVDILHNIESLGHVVGLHFDASLDIGPLEDRLTKEAEILSGLIQTKVSCFSVHNPSVVYPESLKSEICGGLFNASHDHLRETFVYSSDSNGIWRFRPMPDVVSDPTVENLYALTHPEWWTPEAMAPAARLRRCLEGRAAAVATEYAAFIGEVRPEVLSHVE